MGGLTLLTPEAALVGVAVAAPLLAALAAGRRAERARALLRLPSALPDRRRLALIGASFALFALAAAQPALERTPERPVRTDAEAIVVVDVSRSMAAAASPGSPTRLERADEIARAVRRDLPGVPVGLASLTDRVLPHVLPTADVALFETALRKTLGIERPPARDRALQATTLGALTQVVQGRYFSPSARRRLLVVVTDGDSAPFDLGGVATALRDARVRLELVVVGDASERVYGADGRVEPLYRPNPAAAETVEALAQAAGGVAVRSAIEAGQSAEDTLGDGPTRAEGVAARVASLAWLFAAAALVPLVLLLGELIPAARGTMRLAWSRAASR
jgi:hypothetical protein